MKLRLFGLALLGGVSCGASCGAHAETEHERIVAERAAANARFAERERECGARFFVAPCIDEARTDHRAVLSQLRQRELQLDETARRAAAESRRKAIADKAESQQARASDELPQPPGVHFRRAPKPAEPAPARPWNDAMPPRTGDRPPAAERTAIERRNEEKFAARQREADAHREEVARRNAERVAKGKTIAPLPVPPTSPR